MLGTMATERRQRGGEMPAANSEAFNSIVNIEFHSINHPNEKWWRWSKTANEFKRGPKDKSNGSQSHGCRKKGKGDEVGVLLTPQGGWETYGGIYVINEWRILWFICTFHIVKDFGYVKNSAKCLWKDLQYSTSSNSFDKGYPMTYSAFCYSVDKEYPMTYSMFKDSFDREYTLWLFNFLFFCMYSASS